MLVKDSRALLSRHAVLSVIRLSATPGCWEMASSTKSIHGRQVTGLA